MIPDQVFEALRLVTAEYVEVTREGIFADGRRLSLPGVQGVRSGGVHVLVNATVAIEGNGVLLVDHNA